MSSITLFLVSIFILFQLIYSQKCVGWGQDCGDSECCNGMHCKNYFGTYQCSIAPCVEVGNKCQIDDGCCSGLSCNKKTNTCCANKGRPCQNACCPKLVCGTGPYLGYCVEPSK
uniref:Uncharacterized protein n=1 Tax=Meloidogyne floridensis TaxID=298350 RepID=A0A915P5U3_9BILA